RDPSNEESGRQAGALQDPGQHRRGRGLAMRPRNSEHMLPHEYLVGEPLWPGYIALAGVEDRLHQRVAARHDVAHDPDIRLERELARVEALGELDAQRTQLVAHRRIDVGVAARHPVAGRLGDGGDAAHEGAANAEDVKMLRHGGTRFYD